MLFCIRDDDTSFFTTPDELDRAYGPVQGLGTVSLAVVPFHRAGNSKGVPERYRGRWSIHPLHENRELVDYLRAAAADGRYEIMLHGYHHDQPDRQYEFLEGGHLTTRVADGRKYLEDLLGTAVQVFVPPRNTIGRDGLRAIALQGLHLGGVAGIRSGWPKWSARSWKVWASVRRWKAARGAGLPWVLNLGDHREIAGHPVTPLSRAGENEASFDAALAVGGSFCAATHYWELDTQSVHADEPSVGEQLRRLIDRARSKPGVTWRSVGDVVSTAASLP